MPLGLSFRHTMTGSFWLLDSPTDERRIVLSMETHAPDLGLFARYKKSRVRGWISAERLASRKALDGTVALAPLDTRRIAYRLVFEGDDGRRYELGGHKEWRGLSP